MSQPDTDAAGSMFERVRALCLALPEVVESTSWGQPIFCAGKRTFVAFDAAGDRDAIAFHLPHGEIDALLGRKGFSPTPYGAGRWVSMEMRGPPEWAFVESLVLKSYRFVALKSMLQALARAYVTRGIPPTLPPGGP